MGGIKVSDKCKLCPYNEEYKRTIKEFNQIVREHNKLVDEHVRLTNDANSLLRFLEDICKGLRIYVVGVIPLNNTISNTYIEIPEGALWDPGKQFCASFHNEIYSFIEMLKQGERAKDVYDYWIQKCQDIYDKCKGGLM